MISPCSTNITSLKDQLTELYERRTTVDNLIRILKRIERLQQRRQVMPVPRLAA
jgi:hypothetical protein